MAGHRDFSELRQKMSPERRARNQRAANDQLKTMALAALRRASGKTQTELVGKMGIRQPALSKLESQDDMQISTLVKIIEALGGELSITARVGGENFALSLGKK
jgi:DNA-binding Xre family transcriptional regulator